MRGRQGFTLIELLVSMALIVFIMMILSETFAAALDTFRALKSIGDMEERLRTATTIVRADLVADHFEGKRRPSDLDFWDGTHDQGPPREGFFRFVPATPPTSQNEGADDYGITSRRGTDAVLHFTIKLRGNHLKDFATGNAPGLNARTTTFFSQPGDARYQDPSAVNTNLYSTQWAEVAYFMVKNGQQATYINPSNGSTRMTDLYALYRCQYVVTADNSTLNKWPFTAAGGMNASLYEVSCQPGSGGVYYNNPTDLAGSYSGFNSSQPRRRAFQHPTFPEVTGAGPRGTFNPQSPQAWAATLVLTDVLCFDVQMLKYDDDKGQYTYFTDDSYESSVAPGWPYPRLMGLQIKLRVWDLKSSRSRQMTIFQDL